MKNKELHEFISAFHEATPDTELFKQRLRRSLLNTSRKRTIGTKLRGAIINRRDGIGRSNKKLVGFGTSLIAAVLVLSIGVYSYHYSPKAVAEQALDQGIVALQAAPPSKISALAAQFGGDPTKALQEAKQAKDLTTITKAQFDAESKNAPGIFSTTLGSPNGLSETSLSSGAGGVSIVSTQAKAGEAGGTISSGTVTASGIATTTAPVNIKAGVPSEAATSSGPTSVSFSSSSVAGSPASTITSANVPPMPGQAVAAGSGVVSIGANGTVPMLANASTDGGPVIINGVTPSTYLRYTDSKGHVVVLSLDENGLPIFKTVFMTKAEADQLKP